MRIQRLRADSFPPGNEPPLVNAIALRGGWLGF